MTVEDAFSFGGIVGVIIMFVAMWLAGFRPNKRREGVRDGD